MLTNLFSNTIWIAWLQTYLKRQVSSEFPLVYTTCISSQMKTKQTTLKWVWYPLDFFFPRNRLLSAYHLYLTYTCPLPWGSSPTRQPEHAHLPSRRWHCFTMLPCLECIIIHLCFMYSIVVSCFRYMDGSCHSLLVNCCRICDMCCFTGGRVLLLL